jgi:hypothetical protein
VKINLGKSEETSFIIFLASTLIILTSTWFLKTSPTPQPLSIPPEQGQNQLITKKASPPVKFVSQDSLWVSPDESFSLEIIPVTDLSALVYRFEILFDPNILSAEKIIIGDFFKNPLVLREEIDNQLGRIYFSAGLTPEEKTSLGEPHSKNLLATLFLRTKPLANQSKNLETTVSLGEKSLIVNETEQLNDLDQIVQPITIVITNENE